MDNLPGWDVLRHNQVFCILLVLVMVVGVHFLIFVCYGYFVQCCLDMTTSVWNLPLDITQTLFPNSSKHYLLTMMNALRDSHFILSSKIFFPLKRQYWNENDMGKGNALPEVWSTDTRCEGVCNVWQ